MCLGVYLPSAPVLPSSISRSSPRRIICTGAHERTKYAADSRRTLHHFLSLLSCPHSPSSPFPSLPSSKPYRSTHLKRVILGSNLPDPVVANDGDFLHDVGSDFGDVAEEEQGKHARRHAEAGCDGAISYGLARRQTHQVGDVFRPKSTSRVSFHVFFLFNRGDGGRDGIGWSRWAKKRELSEVVLGSIG